jgi:aspartyl-tRNA(Asn)/glutamyl-tRNA(Gln) amidotransferase subunit C
MAKDRAKPKEIDHDTVKQVALLSRLSLTEKELKLYSSQLASILSYISKLNELDTSGVQPTSHAIAGLKNVFRKDTPKPSLAAEDALKNAPSREDGFFRVPTIIEGK